MLMHLLLQILEDGKITDSLGQKIDFRNTIIIMTSNVGAELIKRQTAMGFGATAGHGSYEAMRDKILDESKRVFKRGALPLNGPFAFSVARNGFPIQLARKSPRLFHRCHRTDRVAPATLSVTHCRLRSHYADFEQSIFASKRGIRRGNQNLV
jgi:hypothetical protein